MILSVAMNTTKRAAFAVLWIASFVVLLGLAEADDVTCLCNQFSSDCRPINSTWGTCAVTRGQGLCVATWERSPADNSTIVQYLCSSNLLQLYSCLPYGYQRSGSAQYPIVTACCLSDYCNTPGYLQSIVTNLFPGPTATPNATSFTDTPITPSKSSGTMVTSGSGQSTAQPLATNTVPLATTTSTSENLTCLCNQFNVLGCIQKNNTWGECSLPKNAGVCVASFEKVVNDSTPYVPYSCEPIDGNTYSCLPPVGYQIIGTARIQTCCRSNYCNTPGYLMSFVTRLFPVATTTLLPTAPTSPAQPSRVFPTYVISLMVIFSVIILVCLALLVTFVLLRVSPRLLLPLSRKTADLGSASKPAHSGADGGSCGEQSCDLTEDSGGSSGSGLPLLSQQSIAAQIVLKEVVGKGRFGEVWRGSYRGDSVAVKIFHTREEASWNHEVDIYQTCLMRHPNILRYVASDSKDMGMQMQLWLITEFCDHGSLYDYLQLNSLDEGGVLQLCYTAVCGLTHLHSEIVGREGKPAIAHRDLKSRNVLVKPGMVCCIADLGLGLRYDRASDTVEELPTRRVGTRRYLAPEVITETIGTRSFESFKRADMYSFGLVMWEIARRGMCGGIAEEAQLPFFDALPPDPTIDDMQRVVVMEKRRPGIPNRWSQSQVFSSLSVIIQECWSDVSEARLTALRVKKSLANLQASISKGSKDIENENV